MQLRDKDEVNQELKAQLRGKDGVIHRLRQGRNEDVQYLEERLDEAMEKTTIESRAVEIMGGRIIEEQTAGSIAAEQLREQLRVATDQLAEARDNSAQPAKRRRK